MLLPFRKNQRRDNARVVGRQHQSWFIMLFVSALLFAAIGSRLAYLQLIKGDNNREKAESNRVRILPKQPVRGSIFDRKGKVLATTRISHSIYIWPKVQKDAQWPQLRERLAKILNQPEAEIQKIVQEAGPESPTLVRLARHLTPAQITAIEEYRPLLKGVEVDMETVRHYPNGELGVHVLGYTRELTPEQYKKLKDKGYRLGDAIGKMGLEQSLEQTLRGEWGGLQLEVDGAGRVMKVLGQKPARPGKDVTLTLDLELQKAAEEALGTRKGAIVALDPNTGGILAMASYPRFDPNIFSGPMTPANWKDLQGKDHPFLNRALRGFPPASTFKIVTATAGMESGKFPPNVILPTFAYLRVGGTAFGEWNRAGFGPIGYKRALAMSSNTFHGQVGRGVGGPYLIEWARRYGFGQKTGIDLAQEESAGLIADDTWKRRNFDNWAWSEGDTVNMSIGQGFTVATPLQVAIMFGVPASGGYRVKPHFVAADDAKAKQERVNLHLKPSTINMLRTGLRAVVAEGTGKVLNNPDLPLVAGKSGTAQAPPGENHAWFGAFAPFDKPEIVVVAFAEHSGGGGGSTAGPMILKVMQTKYKKPEPAKKPEEKNKPHQVTQANNPKPPNNRN